MASVKEKLKALQEHLDISTQRKLLFTGFYFVTGLIIYTNLYTLVSLLVVGVAVWYLHDCIDDATATTVDTSGKYVFITGCDSGFGLDSAKAIRDLGFHVIAGCYDDNSAGAKELRDRPWVKKVEVVNLDVSNEASVQAAVTEVKTICSDQGLWALINNAGHNNQGPTELIPMTSYHRTSEVNLFGPIRVIKHCLPLIRQAQGRIVNVTSERVYNHWANSTPYCLTKAGLVAFSNCLSREMAEHNVKVITVAPGEFAPTTAIVNPRTTEALREIVMTEHAKLSLEDQQKAYPTEKLDSLFASMSPEEKAKNGASTSEPVIKAYIDAVSRVEPKRCYMVHGTKRLYLDSLIVMARLRPFLPGFVEDVVEKIVMRVL